MLRPGFLGGGLRLRRATSFFSEGAPRRVGVAGAGLGCGQSSCMNSAELAIISASSSGMLWCELWTRWCTKLLIASSRVSPQHLALLKDSGLQSSASGHPLQTQKVHVCSSAMQTRQGRQTPRQTKHPCKVKRLRNCNVVCRSLTAGRWATAECLAVGRPPSCERWADRCEGSDESGGLTAVST